MRNARQPQVRSRVVIGTRLRSPQPWPWRYLRDTEPAIGAALGLRHSTARVRASRKGVVTLSARVFDVTEHAFRPVGTTYLASSVTALSAQYRGRPAGAGTALETRQSVAAGVGPLGPAGRGCQPRLARLPCRRSRSASAMGIGMLQIAFSLDRRQEHLFVKCTSPAHATIVFLTQISIVQLQAPAEPPNRLASTHGGHDLVRDRPRRSLVRPKVTCQFQRRQISLGERRDRQRRLEPHAVDGSSLHALGWGWAQRTVAAHVMPWLAEHRGQSCRSLRARRSVDVCNRREQKTRRAQDD